jgi:hypothetical protein
MDAEATQKLVPELLAIQFRLVRVKINPVIYPNLKPFCHPSCCKAAQSGIQATQAIKNISKGGKLRVSNNPEMIASVSGVNLFVMIFLPFHYPCVS